MLQHESLALFWSIQCPGNLILQMYAFAQNWRNKDVPVISGFHTPLESECLRILLRSAQPITSLSRKLGSRQIRSKL